MERVEYDAVQGHMAVLLGSTTSKRHFQDDLFLELTRFAACREIVHTVLDCNLQLTYRSRQRDNLVRHLSCVATPATFRVTREKHFMTYNGRRAVRATDFVLSA